MAKELEAADAAKVQGVTTRTITPTVFITGQYGVNPEAVATELTRLMQQLLAYGVFPSAIEAAKKGVPTGTFVVIDDPETPDIEFSVEVVPYLTGGDLDGGPKEIA